MLTEAHFKSFKLLRDVKIPLSRLSVLVGPNGVGKSSVLEGVHYLLQLATRKPNEDKLEVGRPGALFTGKRTLGRLASKPGPSELELEAVLSGDLRFGLRGKPAQDERGADSFHVWFGKAGAATEIDLPGAGIQAQEEFFQGPYDAKLGSVVRLKLHAEALAGEHYSEAEIPRVEYDGDGLASVLQYVHALRDGTLEAIEQALASIVPGVQRIRTMPAKVRRREKQLVSIGGQDFWADQVHERMGVRVEIEWKDIGWVPADQVSEGTLLALGLLTVVHFRAPRLVLLDDLDKALHPVAQRKLVELLRKTLDSMPHLQIVATSHSPFVLDALQLEEVLVLGDGGGRGTMVRRLDEHPSAKKRGAYLRPGELWSLVGEGWVTEGGA